MDKGPWMTETVMLHVRVDERIKDAAALEAMGLTLTEAVRVFLVRVAAEQTIPFAIKVPNAKTRKTMDQVRTVVRSRARFNSADELMDALDAGDSWHERLGPVVPGIVEARHIFWSSWPGLPWSRQ